VAAIYLSTYMRQRGACHDPSKAVKLPWRSNSHGLADDATSIGDGQELGLKSSTLFKIGFFGMGFAIVAAISPVMLAVLGYSQVSVDVGDILDEKTLGLILIIFTGVILRGISKKKEESMLKYISKQANEKS
jgi:hypothetical protein